MLGYGDIGRPIPTPNLRETQQYSYDVVDAPAALPLSLTLVKQHLKIDELDVSEDDYLTLLIKSSTDFFQKYTNRILINTGFQTYFDCFRQSFELVRSRLQTLDGFNYLVNGAPVIVDPSLYYVTNENNYSRIIFPLYQNMPIDKDDRFQSVIVAFTAGYGASDSDIPSDIKLALLNQIAAMYENRGDCSNCDCADISNLPTATQNTYRQYRIMSVYGANYRG